ncbi:MAG: AIR carboxylase family protein [Ardenticatenaceae bacterium]|nr:AIR carboxylase family protein [Anaerolineales bacterium]MCB8919531.1 AIR carboxylase family protein [Ardenticatenaceae bacterium]
MKPIVPILMGSKADLPHARAIAEALGVLGVASALHIGSAHKTPAHVLALLAAYEEDPRPKVFVTIAGRSNALSGFTDAQVTAPVIACPPPSTAFGGADIYSSLRMPSGVAPAVVLDPAGAALLAAKILGVADPALRQRVADFQASMVARLLADDAGLERA